MMNKPTYSIATPDQPRLKIARTEIEAILKKHDLAGVVILHTPGMTEFFYNVRPSYSCAWFDEEIQGVRVKSLVADYGGNREVQLHDQAATANLFHGLAADLTDVARMFSWGANFVSKATQAEHTPATYMADAAEAKRH